MFVGGNLFLKNSWISGCVLEYVYQRICRVVGFFVDVEWFGYNYVSRYVFYFY